MLLSRELRQVEACLVDGLRHVTEVHQPEIESEFYHELDHLAVALGALVLFDLRVIVRVIQ
jgi:hypothetical protein